MIHWTHIFKHFCCSLFISRRGLELLVKIMLSNLRSGNKTNLGSRRVMWSRPRAVLLLVLSRSLFFSILKLPIQLRVLYYHDQFVYFGAIYLWGLEMDLANDLIFVEQTSPISCSVCTLGSPHKYVLQSVLNMFTAQQYRPFFSHLLGIIIPID